MGTPGGDREDILKVDATKLLDNVNRTIKSLNYQLMTTVTDENNIHFNLNTTPFVNTIDCVEGALIYCKIECHHQYSPLKLHVIEQKGQK